MDQNKIETTKQPMENLPAVNGGPTSLEKKGNVIENNIFNSIFKYIQVVTLELSKGNK